jgi:hypothetical protein
MLNYSITLLKNVPQLDIRQNVGGMYYSSPPSRAVQNIGKKYHILAQSREIAQTIKSLEY